MTDHWKTLKTSSIPRYVFNGLMTKVEITIIIWKTFIKLVTVSHQQRSKIKKIQNLSRNLISKVTCNNRPINSNKWAQEWGFRRTMILLGLKEMKKILLNLVWIHKTIFHEKNWWWIQLLMLMMNPNPVEFLNLILNMLLNTCILRQTLLEERFHVSNKGIEWMNVCSYWQTAKSKRTYHKVDL